MGGGSSTIGSSGIRLSGHRSSNLDSKAKTGKLGERNVVTTRPSRSIAPPPPLGLRSPTSLSTRKAKLMPPNLRINMDARSPGIQDRVSLQLRAGRPKDNDTFFKFNTGGRSTGYKNLLECLDTYHNMLDLKMFTSDPNRSLDTKAQNHRILSRLEELDKAAQQIEGSAKQYNKSFTHSRKSEVKTVLSNARSERKVIANLKNQIQNGAKLPDLPLKEIMEFARVGLSLDQMTDKAHINLLQDLKPLMDRGYNFQEAFLLHKSGLGHEGGKLYKKFDIPIRPDTVIETFKDENLVGRMTELGSGKLNTVYNADYKVGDQTFKGVYKPLKAPDRWGRPIEGGLVALKIGIDMFNPRTGLRNIVTCSVAEKLGFDVVPHTQITKHDNKLGLVMSKAPGTEPKNCDHEARSHGDVIRGLMKLQLLDQIVGQGDRHLNNLFIGKTEEGRYVVTGIDNDQCLGKETKNPNDIQMKQGQPYRGMPMPPVVDTEMADAIMNLSKDDFESCLQGLSSEEIEAAQSRLQCLKNHITELREKVGGIISPDAWSPTNVKNTRTLAGFVIAMNDLPKPPVKN